MYVRAGRPAFARPCVGIHKSTSLMSSSLLLQQCPACLVRLTWIVFVIGGRCPYSWCLVGCCCQDLFRIARSILRKKKKLSITAWYLLLHERINVLHSSTNIFSYSLFILIHSSSMFLGFFSSALPFSNFQTLSIGFMYGLWAGHSIIVISSSESLNKLLSMTRSVILHKYSWFNYCRSQLGTCFSISLSIQLR